MDNNNPYAPPKSNLADPPRIHSEYEFHDISTITNVVMVLLALGILLGLLMLGSSLMQLALLGHPYTHEQAVANDLRGRLVSGGWSLLYVVTVIVFGRWIYVAHRNLPALGAERLRYTPGWAVGMFFIPILNLWKPFQAMSDLVRASRDPRYWHLDDTPVLVGFWWALWLVVSTFGNSVGKMNSGANTLDSIQTATFMHIVESVLSLPLYVLALFIVRRVWRDQVKATTPQPAFSSAPV
jgi:hypothetical protein